MRRWSRSQHADNSREIKKDIKIVKTKYIGKFMGISNMSVI